MADEAVIVRREGGAAIIELNRPDALNAWNRDLGLGLKDAILERRRGRRRARRDDHGRRARVLVGRRPARHHERHDARRAAPTCRRSSRSATTRSSRRSARCPSPCWPPSTARRSGIGCSLALASDLIVAAESAYFLLAFVNIGLVPDGGSSLLVPSRVGFTRAAQMAMLGERVGAEQAAGLGAHQPGRPRRRLRGRDERAARAPGHRPDEVLRRDEAPAQPLALRGDRRPARVRGRHPAGDGRVRRLRGGRRRVPREARRFLRWQMSPRHLPSRSASL